MGADQVPAPVRRLEVLKRDLFGSVELWERVGAGRFVVRWVGASERQALPRLPWLLCRLGPFVGLRLARREQRLLTALWQQVALDPDRGALLRGRVPERVPEAWVASASAERQRLTPHDPQAGGRSSAQAQGFGRSFLEGVPLQRAERLSRRYFEELVRLLESLHALGVRHNDLHKEPNLLVDPEGLPALIDFQLASWHPRPSRTSRVRAAEDLRHAAKHARRYRTQAGQLALVGAAPRLAKRSPLAAIWRRLGKPIYRFLTRGVLRWRDGELPRPPAGPWPEWID